MSTETTLAGRIRECAERVGSGDALAEATGIPRRTLESYLTGSSEPKASRLVAIAAAAGVSVAWLATGQYTELATGLAEPSRPFGALDPHLYGVVSGEVARVFKEVGLAASAHTVGEEAAKIAAEILGSGVAGDEALPAVRVLVAQLRRRLFAELAAPETRKRQG